MKVEFYTKCTMNKRFCHLRLLLGYFTLWLLAGETLLSHPVQAQSAPPQAGLGLALQLNGTDDYVAINGMNYSSVQTEVTVEAWVRTTNAGSQVIASFDEAEYWSLTMNAGQVVWSVATDAGNLSLTGGSTINDGGWHHVAAVYSGGIATIYIDGTADGSTGLGTSFGSGANRSGFVGSDGLTDFFDGSVDEVRIWRVERTATEIAAGQFSQFSGLENNLALYYDFEDGTGTTVTDRSPNTADGISPNATDASWIEGSIALGQAIPNQIAVGGQEFPQPGNNTFPTNIFFDEAPIASYEARLTDGSRLPSWLRFNENTGTFSGTPPNIPNSLQIRLTASDNDGQTASDVFTLLVQTAPSISLDAITPKRGYETTFEEGSPPVDITASSVAIEDLDGTLLTEFNINFNNNIIEEDSLIITPQGLAAASAAGINIQEYNSISGSIILTGRATLAQYAEVLEWVQYYNRQEDPTGGPRIVSFLATDEDGNTNSAVSIIDIIPENDGPDLDLNSSSPGSGYETTYIEGNPPVPIASRNVSLDDIDYHDGGSFIITLVNRPDTLQESLQVIGNLPAGIFALYNDTTGVMELRGAASLDDYELALQQIGYQNASRDPDLTPRLVSITFDDGDGGESTSSATTRVNIIPVNDPPDELADTVIVAEYSRANVILATLPTDVDNELSELTLTVVRLPTLGRVTYADGTPLEAGDPLDSTQFADLQYDAPDNYDGASDPGALVYSVSDGEFSAQSTITFMINNAPEADDFTVTTDEDVPYVFTLADFAARYSDTEGDSLAYVVISSLPADGWLLLEGDTVQLDDSIRISALDSGKLVLAPALNANGDPYTSFLFRVQDDRFAMSEPYVAVLIVTPVSDRPAVDTVRVMGEENEMLFFTAHDFTSQFSDPEGDTLTMIKIGSLPPNGRLLFNSRLVQVGDEISVDSLSQLAFEPNFGFDGATEFRWNGHDGSTYAEEPAPVIITIEEDNRLTALNDTIRLVDVTTYEGSLTDQVVNPAGGDFTFSLTPIVNTQHGTLSLRSDGTYTYQTTEDFSGTDSFTFEVCNTNTPPPVCAGHRHHHCAAAPARLRRVFSGQ